MLAAACALLLLAAPASQAVVIGFDDQAAGALLDEQYAALGVHFGPSPFPRHQRQAERRRTANTGPLGRRTSPPSPTTPAPTSAPPGSASTNRSGRSSFYACRTGGGGDPPQPNVNVDAYDSTGLQIDNRQGIPCTLNGPLDRGHGRTAGDHLSSTSVGPATSRRRPVTGGRSTTSSSSSTRRHRRCRRRPPRRSRSNRRMPSPPSRRGLFADPLLAPRLIGTAAVDSMIGTSTRETCSPGSAAPTASRAARATTGSTAARGTIACMAGRHRPGLQRRGAEPICSAPEAAATTWTAARPRSAQRQRRERPLLRAGRPAGRG